MSLFSKTTAVLFPRAHSLDIYLDRSENNNFSFDINLWRAATPQDLEPLAAFFKQYKYDNLSVLIPDDVVLTKAFIYDTQTTDIEKKEVIGLAESFVHFKIDPDYIEYRLLQENGKTIIQSVIYDKEKIDILKANLAALQISNAVYKPVSAAVSSVISTFYTQEYFLIYPLHNNEYTLILSRGDSVYLTSNLKGPTLDIQKIINYSNLYFQEPIKKLFYPADLPIEVVSTAVLDKTEYNQPNIASKFNKASNLPLPVLGLIIKATTTSSITAAGSPVSTKPMQQKKNILPIVAVFIFTAALASVIIWFVLNRNNTTAENTASPVETVTPTREVTPTDTPTPTVVAVDKNIKIQVLNGTDINGQAALLKATLTGLGFKNVAVGNSKEKLTANEVRIKPSLATSSAYFQSQISGFPATVNTTLPEKGTFDAVFVIGTDLRAAASGAPAADTTATDTVTPTVVKKATPTVSKSKVTPTPSITSINRTSPTATPTSAQ